MRKTGRVWKWISGTALAAVLLLVLAPQTAMASESSDAAWNALQEEFNSASTDANTPTQITLSGNVTAGEGNSALVIPTGRYVTLDLDGHTIDRGLTDQDAVVNGNVITVNGNLTLTDSSDNQNTSAYDGTGKLTGGNTTDNGGGVIVSGTFTMEGGTISGCEATNGGGVYVNSGKFNSGTFIMNGGS
ncbi:MAG: hypothetical protein II800_07020, partial [Lachnospiraceae bacterium]|nr:hypothetical protein [Lachnospiraceae bacterium]